MANSNVTPYGKELRKLRIDYGEGLADMAGRIGITPSYLCMIERGNRSIPSGFTDKIAKAYSLSAEACSKLIDADSSAK